MAVNGPRRGGDHIQLADVAAQAVLYVNKTMVAETLNQVPGRGIDGIQKVVGRVKDAAIIAVGPIDHPTINAQRIEPGAITKGIEAPLLVAGGGIEGHELQSRCGSIKDALDNERIALDLREIVLTGVAGVVDPGDFQPADIARGDLF